MKYLRKHETISEFQAYSDDQIENDRPNTSYVEEQSKVYFTDKDYLKEYLTFKSLDANEIGFHFGYGVPTSNAQYIEYSVNDGEWERITNRNNAEVSDSIQVNEGDTIRWRGIANSFAWSDTEYNNGYYHSCFTTRGPFNVYGNLMSIFYGNNFEGKTGFSSDYSNNAACLFMSAEIVSAGNLICPVTTLKTASYSKMFKNCTYLKVGPKFTYSTLAEDAFYEAFYGCSSLTVLPKCNFSAVMSSRCYSNMFAHCTSLTQSPIIDAEFGGWNACSQMFSGCTKLKKITCMSTEMKLGQYCTENWVYGVSKTGIFIGNPECTWIEGDGGIPKGWVVRSTNTSHTYEPNYDTFCVLVDDFPDDDPSFYETGDDTMEDVFDSISEHFEYGEYNNGISEYWYSGESIEYDGGTWYVFVRDGYDAECLEKKYLLMDTNDPNELYRRSACYSIQNYYHYGYDGDDSIGIFLRPDLQESYGPNTYRSNEIIISVLW